MEWRHEKNVFCSKGIFFLLLELLCNLILLDITSYLFFFLSHNYIVNGFNKRKKYRMVYTKFKWKY